MNKFYITIAIPYVNGRPHLGHALEYFQADTIRRYHDLLGDKTLLLSGADENALKNVQAAEKEGVPTREFLDRNSQVFKDAFEKLGVHLDVFQRGSDQKLHWPGVQELWRRCLKNGDIYKKAYEGLYCVGCESFKAASELTPDGLCPEHLKKPDSVKEENYFFKLSSYQEKLIELIESNALKIVPENKRAETLNFIKSGLEDFSVSRSNERARGVGVPVPDDPSQVMYVWFDALSIYITGIGFDWDKNKFSEWWPADLQIIGKDINRFHTVYWPAMLLSAGLPLAKQVLIHSFINAPSGQKMSKSLGNVVDPFETIESVGVEGLRYYLLSQIPLAEDGEASVERIKEIYNAHLANGLGNLVARVAKLAEKHRVSQEIGSKNLSSEVQKNLEEFKFNDALSEIWKRITLADQQINESKPWELEGEKAKEVLTDLSKQIVAIAIDLQPFLPETSEKILKQFSGEIKSQTPLFPRIS